MEFSNNPVTVMCDEGCCDPYIDRLVHFSAYLEFGIWPLVLLYKYIVLFLLRG